jgi:hypothetical protein
MKASDLVTIDELLEDLSTRPCACGKRKCGDKQDVVGTPRASIIPGCWIGDSVALMRSDLKCTVCGNIHQATLSRVVTADVIEILEPA